MAQLSCAAKFDPFLSLDCAPTPSNPGAMQGKEGIKFCRLATLRFVMTAAHCTEYMDANELMVIVAEHDLSVDDDNARTVEVRDPVQKKKN